MKYVSVDDLVSFALSDESLWLYPKEPMDLRPFIEHAIKFGGVRAVEEEDDTGTLKKLEKRIKTLEEAVWPKNIDYGSYSDSDSDSMAPAVREIDFESRGEAIHILERMRDTIQKFGGITIANYYYISGKPEYISYKLFDYGWTNLNSVAVYSYLKKGGSRVYGLKLPDPMPIENH